MGKVPQSRYTMGLSIPANKYNYYRETDCSKVGAVKHDPDLVKREPDSVNRKPNLVNREPDTA